jgi:large subunit ribosomal protein L25
MAHETTLTAYSRTATGKGAARALRRAGRIPAVIYGPNRDAEALELDATEAGRLVQAIGGHTSMVDVTIAGRPPVKALIREIQRNPVRPTDLLHLDLYEITADEEITVDVPVHLTGIADGVRNFGGVLDHVLHRITLRVLPAHLPDHIEVDVTALGIAQAIFVRDLSVPDAVILNDPGQAVCTVVPPRTEAEAAPAEVPAEEAEPELIRKPKAEEGDAEE